MKSFAKTICYKVFDYEELDQIERLLIQKATEVRLNAQASYSRYKVGAAVLSAKGIIHQGCNVENANWTATLHAEHNAIGNMVAVHGAWTKVKKVAIVAGPENETAVITPERLPVDLFTFEEIPVPCGHCLQIIWENCFNDPHVRLMGLISGGLVTVTTIGDALPMRFGPADLGVSYQK